ncbi:MAG TPA: fibronectin type III domain-containing protein [Bacteroidia bacterium]|nr:fibronectin type III domain-containing protein [Bacteroidia bacterium]
MNSILRADSVPPCLRGKNLRSGIIAFILFFTGLSGVNAQTYPIQVSLQLIPPFSGYITDYGAPGNDNLRAYILDNDLSHPSYDVKLKIKIEGQGIVLQSAGWYFSNAFTLTPGVPLMISGSDLAGLLNENNLDFSGITRAQYDQRRVLPEGFYTISLTAYDYVNPVPIQVSNVGMTQAWMTLNDPPYLNFPACGNEIAVTDPQQITFSWTAINVNEPWNAAGTEYKFELWEIFPANQNPGNIVASTSPIYTLTTNLTMISYGITEPPLVVGRQYVWRVTARNLDDRALFRNNGISQLCTFTWGNTNSLLGNIANLTLNVQPLTHRQARASWDSLSVYDQYHLRFKKANTNTSWFTYTTPNRTLRICDLEPETDYIAMVQGVFPNGDPGNWSDVVTFHTPAQQQLNCGDVAVPPANQNFHPLTQANTGMIWQVGQFEMTVTALNNTSSAGGWYSGFGKIILPFGVTLNVGYTSIQMGDDEVMYSGEVRALSEGMTEWMTQYNMSQFHYDTSYFYNENVDSLWVNANGDLVILDENGQQTIIDIDNSGGALVTDSNGDQWIVNPDGTITFVTGGFLLPFTNDTLNQQEMNILKLAMTTIRNGLSQSTIDQQENQMSTTEVSLGTYIDQERSALPNNVPAVGETIADTSMIISYHEVEASAADQGATLGKNFKEAQTNYYSSRVLKIFSREDAPDAELNFIGQYLSVNSIPYKQYVSQQLAAGKTEQQIADLVAENGIKKLVTLVITKQMSKE